MNQPTVRDVINVFGRIHDLYDAKTELLTRLAKGECFLDAIDDTAAAHKLDAAQKKALTEYGLSI